MGLAATPTPAGRPLLGAFGLGLGSAAVVVGALFLAALDGWGLA